MSMLKNMSPVPSSSPPPTLSLLTVLISLSGPAEPYTYLAAGSEKVRQAPGHAMQRAHGTEGLWDKTLGSPVCPAAAAAAAAAAAVAPPASGSFCQGHGVPANSCLTSMFSRRPKTPSLSQKPMKTLPSCVPCTLHRSDRGRMHAGERGVCQRG